jgi:hypothetical protein
LLPLCVGCAAWSVIGQLHIIQERTKIPVGARLGNAVYSYGLYLRDAVWPAALAVDYPFALGYSLDAVAAFKLGLVVSFLAAISALVWKQRFARPHLVTGWLWYLGTLLPVSGVLWMGNYSHADRYAYIPLIGIFVIGVWTAAEWADRKQFNFQLRIATAVILGILSCLTWRQIHYWQSDYELWTHAVNVESRNPLADMRLAEVIYDQALHQDGISPGDFRAAVEGFRRATILYDQEMLERAPLDAEIEMGLAATLMAGGRPADAIAENRKVIRGTTDPLWRAIVYGEIAQICRATGDRATMRDSYSEARKSYREALKANPDRVAKLTAQFAARIKSDPTASHLFLLGIFLQEMGDPAEAQAAFEQIHQLEPAFDILAASER